MPEVALPQKNSMELLKDALAAQHPFHQMMGEVFEEIGGKAALKEWAEEHPGQFFGYIFKATPTIAPTTAVVGDVNIVINNHLIPTALDRVTLDEQGRVVND